MTEQYDVFLICPVRNASFFQKNQINKYIEKMKADGKTVYYPATDTDQNDTTGFRICTDNKNAIINSKSVAIYWDENSTGSLFDLGIAFCAGKSIEVVNMDELVETEKKSFTNMIRHWSFMK